MSARSRSPRALQVRPDRPQRKGAGPDAPRAWPDRDYFNNSMDLVSAAFPACRR